jgi:hypothetical protein
VALRVEQFVISEQIDVATIDRGQLDGVGERLRGPAGPGAKRGAEAGRGHPVLAQLDDQPAGGAREPGAGGGVPERLQPQRGDRAPQDPLALERADPPLPETQAHADLVEQPGEGQHPSERHARGGQLTLVVGDVERGGHDQQRVALSGEGICAQHFPCLRRVGGTENQGERHRCLW